MPEIYATGIDGTNYTPDVDLDLDSPYTWIVKAYDGELYGQESDAFNYTVQSLVDVSLVAANISMSGLEPGDNMSTVNETPPPFVIENNGNVFVNLSVSANGQLWENAPLGTKYFRFMAGENSSKPNSFNMSLSASDWLNMSSTGQLAVADLDYNDSSDYAEIEIAAEVPQSEPPGVKSTNVVIEAVGTKP
jgi:hypothetical protein